MLIKTVIILAAIGVITYFLYLNGYITIQNKKAEHCSAFIVTII